MFNGMSNTIRCGQHFVYRHRISGSKREVQVVKTIKLSEFVDTIQIQPLDAAGMLRIRA